jgi:hypothetical protein
MLPLPCRFPRLTRATPLPIAWMSDGLLCVHCKLIFWPVFLLSRHCARGIEQKDKISQQDLRHAHTRIAAGVLTADWTTGILLFRRSSCFYLPTRRPLRTPTLPPVKWVRRALYTIVTSGAKNTWSYTSTFPYAFIVWRIINHRGYFTVLTTFCYTGNAEWAVWTCSEILLNA